MRFADLLRLAVANLRRNGIRSVLTLVGVCIGVAALLALLSYGAGVQQNAHSEFAALELYNTLRVTSTPNPIQGLSDLTFKEERETEDTTAAVPVTDSLLRQIEQIEGVRVAYPEVGFPAQLTANGRQVVANAEAVPQAFAEVAGYQPTRGRFFAASADSALMMSASMARRLGFEDPEAAVGDTVTLTTASLDLGKLQAAAMRLGQGLTSLPLTEQDYRLRIAGLLPEENQTVSGFTRVVLPLERAQALRKVTFFSTLDLLLRKGTPTDGYSAARIQLADGTGQRAVQEQIEAMGVYATSFRSQFEKLERLFIIMDLALGIVGFIALLVATVGIANTMAMNVRERYREIGIMKAVGGAEADLQRLFVVESGALGLIGGLLGLVVGWGVIQLIDWGVGLYLYQQGVPPFSIFHTTPLMVGGILAVALAVSLAAGTLPARKAARIEPLEALRST